MSINTYLLFTRNFKTTEIFFFSITQNHFPKSDHKERKKKEDVFF